MTSSSLLLLIAAGIALQAGLVLGIGIWKRWRSYSRLAHDRPPPQESQSAAGVPPADAAGWPGFRRFKVTRRMVEDSAGQVCSFFLEPEVRHALAPYRPGQFLTFRLEVPKADGSGTEQITRCYSLSDAPHPGHYRVSIKRVPPPPGSRHPPGRASNFFHDHVPVGATLQVRAPSGHFNLEPGSSPIVLIAGGIGITPLLSMLGWCQAHQSGREVWVFYGVRNSREAAFESHLNAIAAADPNTHVRLCFSAPLADDRPGKDFHHRGRIDGDLLRIELPHKPYHYYLCGPAPMMESLVAALEDQGVPESRIHFEAFGPASIRRRKPGPADAQSASAAPAGAITVTFARTGRQLLWSAQSDSLLEFAEANGIAIDSGCRAGACGTCQTALRSGDVTYRQTPEHAPEPGTCLVCVCTPATDVTLVA